MNKKLLLITLFLFFCLHFAFADPIVVEGFGNTYEEATNNSLKELSSFISTEVSSVTQSSLLVEGEKIKEDSFSDNLILSSYSKLIGVEYNKKQDVDGLKCVEATIPDSNSVQVQYKNRITDILNEINKTNSLLEKTKDDNDKLQYLEFILSYIKMFKNYKFIMLHLNDSWLAPSLPLSETALKVQYINLLNKQQKLLDDKIANLQLVLSEKEQQQSDKLNQVIAQRDKISTDRDKAIAEEEKWRQGVRDSKTAEIINKADALKVKSLERKNADISLLIPSKNPLAMIKQIETKVISYENSCESVLKEVKALRLQTEKDFFEDKEKISNRKISIAEKTNGKETEQSKKYTQYLIIESKKSFFEQYKENRTTLLNAVETEINKDYETIVNNVDVLNKTKFVIDSRVDNVNITIGQYDGAKNKWPVVVNFAILDKIIEMEFGLGYEDFTQSKIPSIGESGAYSSRFKEYLEKVEVLEAYFADLESDPISIKLQYSVSLEKEAVNHYAININKMIVTRNDNNEQIIKSLLSPNQIDDLKYRTSDGKTSLAYLKGKIVLEDKKLTDVNVFLLQDWNLLQYEISFNFIDKIETLTVYGDCEGARVTIPVIPKRSGYRFDGWYKDERYKNASNFYADKVTSDITLYPYWKVFSEVGNFGQAGGYIFYDKGSYSDGWRYMEAAPYGWFLGKKDPGYSWYNAIKLCQIYSEIKDGIVYDDWFLPKKNVLSHMYANLKVKNLGGFSDGYYWSSSEYNANLVWEQDFSDGSQGFINEVQYNEYYRYNMYRVRPVRCF